MRKLCRDIFWGSQVFPCCIEVPNFTVTHPIVYILLFPLSNFFCPVSSLANFFTMQKSNRNFGWFGCPAFLHFQLDSDLKWPDCPHMPSVPVFGVSDPKVRPTTLNPPSSLLQGVDPRCAMPCCPDKGSMVSQLTLGSLVTGQYQPILGSLLTFDCGVTTHPAFGVNENFVTSSTKTQIIGFQNK